MLKSKTAAVCATGLCLTALMLGPPAVAQEDPGCTLTQGFWKNHPEAWPVDRLTLGVVPYEKEDLIVLLATPTRSDATYILAKQLIAAKLNVLNGADAGSVGVAIVIVQADEWLIDHKLGTWPMPPDREVGIQLAEQLDDFNNGLSGVPHCDDAVVLPPPDPDPQD